MTDTMTDILSLLSEMKTISLEEMSAVKLMKRNDTKYVTNVPTLMRLLQLTQSKYYVQEINDSRIANYNTLYWDFCDDHHYYLIHAQKRKPRTKVRTRRYVDSGIAFLEIKRKDNHGKTRKKRVKVPMQDTIMQDSLVGEPFLEEQLGLKFSDLIPAMSNFFSRITLVNYEKTERVTIDFNLRFDNHETGKKQRLDNLVIIELKRDGRTHSPLLAMLRELRIKPSGFSKYVIGSAITNSSLRQNLLRKRLRTVAKRINHPDSYLKEYNDEEKKVNIEN
ncbi:polyphosphate polymerase domain-containing protein [Pseudoprevotella muciniphila]|uniref:Polyphosphate polymerase domain-containing protein n=1 Tax=Pseudoprevotella muciniphila TaxID=2133944 RepID=A0A5P8E8B3_9BACT|nr:polyphosphate polymerase domain-containing protein [Pseudoprevotella muciniphila]QFQ13265.1 polyphosphate polymerase domain-containing protein [Pseudoprevotella muciniphila]